MRLRLRASAEPSTGDKSEDSPPPGDASQNKQGSAQDDQGQSLAESESKTMEIPDQTTNEEQVDAAGPTWPPLPEERSVNPRAWECAPTRLWFRDFFFV